MAIKKPNLSNIYSTQADAANRDNKIAEDQLLPEYWDDIEYKDMGDGTYLLYKEGENGEEIGMGWTNDDGFEVPAVESVNEIVSALDKAKAEYTDLHDSNQMSDEAYAEKMNEISIKLEKISDYTDLRDSGQMTDEQLAEKVKEIYNSKSISAMDALKEGASSGANLAVEGANVGHEAASQANNNFVSTIEAGLGDLVTQINHYQDAAAQAKKDGLTNSLSNANIGSYEKNSTIFLDSISDAINRANDLIKSGQDSATVLNTLKSNITNIFEQNSGAQEAPLISLVQSEIGKFITDVNQLSSDMATSQASEMAVDVVTPQMQSIADTAMANAGCGYDNGCQAWAGNLWASVTGIPAENSIDGIGSAYDAWVKYGVSDSMENIPVGAMVYGAGWDYPGYVGENPFGHVGIYVGNGQVADQGGVWDIEAWSNAQTTNCNGQSGYFGWGWQNNIDLSKQ